MCQISPLHLQLYILGKRAFCCCPAQRRDVMRCDAQIDGASAAAHTSPLASPPISPASAFHLAHLHLVVCFHRLFRMSLAPFLSVFVVERVVRFAVRGERSVDGRRFVVWLTGLKSDFPQREKKKNPTRLLFPGEACF